MQFSHEIGVGWKIIRKRGSQTNEIHDCNWMALKVQVWKITFKVHADIIIRFYLLFQNRVCEDQTEKCFGYGGDFINCLPFSVVSINLCFTLIDQGC
jgi:hypothetical protein